MYCSWYSVHTGPNLFYMAWLLGHKNTLLSLEYFLSRVLTTNKWLGRDGGYSTLWLLHAQCFFVFYKIIENHPLVVVLKSVLADIFSKISFPIQFLVSLPLQFHFNSQISTKLTTHKHQHIAKLPDGNNFK